MRSQRLVKGVGNSPREREVNHPPLQSGPIIHARKQAADVARLVGVSCVEVGVAVITVINANKMHTVSNSSAMERDVDFKHVRMRGAGNGWRLRLENNFLGAEPDFKGTDRRLATNLFPASHWQFSALYGLERFHARRAQVVLSRPPCVAFGCVQAIVWVFILNLDFLTVDEDAIRVDLALAGVECDVFEGVVDAKGSDARAADDLFLAECKVQVDMLFKNDERLVLKTTIRRGDAVRGAVGTVFCET